LVAGYLGSGDQQQAGRVGTISTRLSLWSAGVLALVLAVSSPWLPALFTNDHAVHTRLMGALLVLAVLQFPGAVAFALDGALIGADDKPWLARQAVRNIVAFVPLAVATVVWPRLGLAGIWGAQVCWMVMRAWANSHRWRALVRSGFAATIATAA
jgi:Na+-driven multidrug efflux pump